MVKRPYRFLQNNSNFEKIVLDICLMLRYIRQVGSKTDSIRGYSSAGRALEWHSRGQRFDPAYLHHRKSHRKPFGLRCFSLFLGKFQTFYAKLIFAQNRQNGHLSTKFVNKLRFWRQKGVVHRNKLQQKNRPADNWTAFFLLDYEFCSIHSATSSSDKSKRIPPTTPFVRMSMIINPH